jgi:hypothetical protein
MLMALSFANYLFSCEITVHLLRKVLRAMNKYPQKVFNVRWNVVQRKSALVLNNQAYEIDEVGLSIWELCDGNHSVEEIAELLTQEYDVEYTRALEDCQEFIGNLMDWSLLQ